MEKSSNIENSALLKRITSQISKIYRRVITFEIVGLEARATHWLGENASGFGVSIALNEATPLRWCIEAASPIIGSGRSAGGDTVAKRCGMSCPRAFAVFPLVRGQKVCGLIYADQGPNALPPDDTSRAFALCQRWTLDDPPKPQRILNRPHSRRYKTPKISAQREVDPWDTEDTTLQSRPGAFDVDALAMGVALDAIEEMTEDHSPAKLLGTHSEPSQDAEDPEEIEISFPEEDFTVVSAPENFDPFESLETKVRELLDEHPNGPKAFSLEDPEDYDVDVNVPDIIVLPQIAEPPPPLPKTNDAQSQSALTTPPPQTVADHQPIHYKTSLASPQGVLSKNAGPKKGSRGAFAILILLLSAVSGTSLYQSIAAPTRFSSPQSVAFKEGESLRQLAQKLQTRGILRSSRAFLIATSLLKTKARPGHYVFEEAEDLVSVIKNLEQHEVVLIEIEVLPGDDLLVVAKKIERAGLSSASAFLKASQNPSLIQRIGSSANSVEGYLYPSHYKISPDVSPSQIIEAMIAEFFAHILEHKIAQKLSPDALFDTLKLASVVQKESPSKKEFKKMAGLLKNRIQENLPIESPATQKYLADIQMPKDYLTPICNPSREALMAVLSPAEHDYLYFLAVRDGPSVFSRDPRPTENSEAHSSN